MKIAVIGSGFFGLAISFALKKDGHDITVFEKQGDILKGASHRNQFRFHLGYHYPRSQKTVDEIKKANKSFIRFYGKKIFGNTNNYYSVAKKNSKISFGNYLKFIKKNNLFFKKSKENYDKTLMSSYYLSKEKNLNFFKFKKIAKKKIIENDIKILKNYDIKKNDLKKFDKIIVCCYSNNNYVLKKLGIKNLEKYRYELVEKAIVKLPKKYKKNSYILIDGNFFCLDPYLGTNYHLLSDVHLSKIEVIKDYYPEFKNIAKKYLENGKIIKKKANSKKFLKNCQKYLPILKKAKVIGSFYVTRSLSLNKNSKFNDERLSYITKHSEKIISVLAGKWNTSIYISKKVRELISIKAT
jgi:L-2-hydroxyglutarate oxidase LhgO